MSYASIYMNNLDNLELKDSSLTYINLNYSPDLSHYGKLLIIGDSYSFLLCKYSGTNVNYIVHIGYTLDKINNEFLPLIKPNSFEYALLFIGPNDFFNQTDIETFSNQLKSIVNDLSNKGINLILTNYYEPSYTSKNGLVYSILPIKCFQYDSILKRMATTNNLIYIDISDILNKYGYYNDDGVHPDADVYPSILYRILQYIY